MFYSVKDSAVVRLNVYTCAGKVCRGNLDCLKTGPKNQNWIDVDCTGVE